MLRWISQTIAVTLARHPDDSAAAGLVDRRAHRHRRRRRRASCRCCRSAKGSAPTLVGAGSPSRAIVLRNGSESEMTSGLHGAGDRHRQAGAGPRASRATGRSPPRRCSSSSICNKRSTGTPANVPLRGIEPESLPIRDEVKIVEGRALQFGTNEAIVGRAALRAVRGHRSRQRVHVGSAQAEDRRRVHDERLGRPRARSGATPKVLQGAYRRGNSYQSVLAQLDSPASFDTFKNWLTTNPQLNVDRQARERLLRRADAR